MNNDDKFNNIDIDYVKILSIIWKKKLFITFITSIAAIVSIIYALNLPNIYLSKTILAPSDNEDSLSLGIKDLPFGSYSASSPLGNASPPKSLEAMERIKSFEFFSNHFLPYIKLENITATKDWIPEKNIIVYDDNIYDEEDKKWVRKASFPKTSKPSNQEAFKLYKKILDVSEDKNTYFVTISVEHHSPYVAQKWVGIITKQINESMRMADASLAKKSIAFLNESSKSTSVQSLKDVTSRLLEEQMQILMLSSSNPDYIYKTIDSPIISEEKYKPSRALICILGTILGVVISLIIILIQNIRKNISS